MTTIKVAKFDPLHNKVAEDTIISITEALPAIISKCIMPIEEVEEYFEAQADQIADALFNSLPQGTLDRLHIKLMQHKTSLYQGKTES